MRHLTLFLLLLMWALGATCQVSLDSAFWEKEDSMGLLTIKAVKHPKKLLKQVINRLHKDLQETHQARRYRIEATFRKGSIPPYSASCIYSVEGDNGLEIIGDKYSDISDTNKVKAPKLEDFCFEGPFDLYDTIRIKFDLIYFLLFSPSHPSNEYHSNQYYNISPFADYEETARWYNVMAYDIVYGPDKGMYRIILEKKNDRYLWREGDHNFWVPDIRYTAYFDRRSLRITQIKGEQTFRKDLPYPFNSRFDTCLRFQADYDEERGMPVLKGIQYIFTTAGYNDRNYESRNATVQRLDQ